MGKLLDRFTHTANDPVGGGSDASHTRSKSLPTRNPMSREEGTELVRRVLSDGPTRSCPSSLRPITRAVIASTPRSHAAYAILFQRQNGGPTPFG